MPVFAGRVDLTLTILWVVARGFQKTFGEGPFSLQLSIAGRWNVAKVEVDPRPPKCF